MDVLEALARRRAVRHITTRHEQGAAFMADVYGRLTGRAAVAMATLGPGATNLVTGHRRRVPRPRADGRAHRPGGSRQAPQGGPPGRRHRRACSSRSRSGTTRVERTGAIPEIVRKAFRVATLEKPGPTHIELPENLAGATRRAATSGRSIPAQAYFPEPTDEAIAHAARLHHRVERPIILAGNGVLRRRASAALRAFAKGLHLPVAATFMGKGAIDDRSHLSLMAVGLQARDHVLTGLRPRRPRDLGRLRPGRVRAGPLEPGRREADHPHRHPAGRGRRRVPARGRADRRHRRRAAPAARGGPAGRHRRARRDASATSPARRSSTPDLRTALLADLQAVRADDGYPIKPQQAIVDLRRALGPEDIVVSDVGAHKIWVARLYQAYEPNTVDHLERLRGDGHLAARRDRGQARPPGPPGRRAVRRRRLPDELQELETAKRIGANIVGRRLARRRLRADRLEAAQRVRPAVRRSSSATRTSSPTRESFGIPGFRPASRPPTCTRR